MTTRYVKATFADGHTVARSSLSRTYSHAWRVKYNNSWRLAREYTSVGFSGSLDLANKASSLPSHCTLISRDVAPCVEITAREYRAIKEA
jgi:hypothetical protein